MSINKAHQQEYYDRLMQVRNNGNFEAWVSFFLEGIVTVSDLAVQATKRIQQLELIDTEKLIDARLSSGLRLVKLLMRQPVVRVRDIERGLGVSYTKANKIVETTERLGILKQINEGRRNRKFAYESYIAMLAEGTELSGAPS